MTSFSLFFFRVFNIDHSFRIKCRLNLLHSTQHIKHASVSSFFIFQL